LLKGKVSESELLEIKLKLAAQIWGKGGDANSKVNAVLIFLENLLVFDDPETNVNFMRKLDAITGKQNTMGVLEQLAEIKEKEGREEGLQVGREQGLQDGREEGRFEAQRLMVKNLLSHTEFSDEKIAELANISVEIVKEIREGLSRR